MSRPVLIGPITNKIGPVPPEDIPLLFVGAQGAETEGGQIVQGVQFWWSADGLNWNKVAIPQIPSGSIDVVNYAGFPDTEILAPGLQYANGMWGCVLTYDNDPELVFVASRNFPEDANGNVVTPPSLQWSTDGRKWTEASLAVRGLPQLRFTQLYYAQGNWVLTGSFVSGVDSAGDQLETQWACYSYDGKLWKLALQQEPNLAIGVITVIYNPGPPTPAGNWRIQYPTNSGFETVNIPNPNADSDPMFGNLIGQIALGNPADVSFAPSLFNNLPDPFTGVRNGFFSTTTSVWTLDLTTDTVTPALVNSGTEWPAANWNTTLLNLSAFLVGYGMSGVTPGYVVWLSYTGQDWSPYQPFSPTSKTLELEWDDLNNQWLIVCTDTGQIKTVANPNPRNKIDPNTGQNLGPMVACNLVETNPAENFGQTGGVNYIPSSCPLPGLLTGARYGFSGTGEIDVTEQAITPDDVASGSGWPDVSWFTSFQLTLTGGNNTGLYYGEAGSNPGPIPPILPP